MKELLRSVRFFLWASVIAVALCATATGCALFESPNKAFIAGVDAGVNANGLLDEYLAYVEADPKLKPESKKIKANTVAELRHLIKTAQGK